MNAETRAQHKTQLRAAYALIKAGQKAEALELITPILAQQPDNIDAWWLAAHAATTPRQSAFACQKVLTLRPDHWPAQQMLAEQQRLLAVSSIHSEQAIDFSQPIPLKHVRRRKRSIRPWQILLVLTVSIVVVAGFLTLVNVTGHNFGLPIGEWFSAEYEVAPVNVFMPGKLGNTEAMARQVGSLVIGARHDYHFVGRVNSEFMAMVDFSTIQHVLPGEAMALLDAEGNVLAHAPEGRGKPGTLYYRLPYNGRYTLRLSGTAGKAQGAYSLLLALSFEDLDTLPSQ